MSIDHQGGEKLIGTGSSVVCVAAMVPSGMKQIPVAASDHPSITQVWIDQSAAALGPGNLVFPSASFKNDMRDLPIQSSQRQASDDQGDVC